MLLFRTVMQGNEERDGAMSRGRVAVDDASLAETLWWASLQFVDRRQGAGVAAVSGRWSGHPVYKLHVPRSLLRYCCGPRFTGDWLDVDLDGWLLSRRWQEGRLLHLCGRRVVPNGLQNSVWIPRCFST